jgi:hypothetical protein
MAGIDLSGLSLPRGVCDSLHILQSYDFGGIYKEYWSRVRTEHRMIYAINPFDCFVTVASTHGYESRTSVGKAIADRLVMVKTALSYSEWQVPRQSPSVNW